MNRKIRNFITIIFLLGLVLTSCTQPTQINTSAQTQVAQTLTAISSDLQTQTAPTETPIPPTPTNTATIAPTDEVVSYGPTEFPNDVNPLTGMKVADPQLLNRRPVLLKVANFPASGRPHAGLSFADIVFEYYIGEGINRFMALYYGQDSAQIGPIRSGRLVDPYLTMMYGGVLGFKGADAQVYSHIVSLLGDRAITGTEFTCPAICDNGEGTVISIFGDSSAFDELLAVRGINNVRQNLDGTLFEKQAPSGGLVGEQANVIFNIMDKGQWIYDEDSGKYLRWIEDTDLKMNVTMIPLVDRITDEQLGFSNVVILFAEYDEISPTLHDVAIWENRSGQRAIVFRDGQAYDVLWRTVDQNSPIEFTTKDGNLFAFKPGNTWMVIMGMNSGVKQSEGTWDFNFFLP